MKTQQGAALIIVLVLLTVSLMLGLSSVQSSLIDERLAGNYRAATQAQMNAERAASNMWNGFSGTPPSIIYDSDDEFGLDDDFDWNDFKNFADSEPSGCDFLEGTDDSVACYISISNGFGGKEDGSYIVAMGAISNGSIAESAPIFLKLIAGFPDFIHDAVLSCSGDDCNFTAGNGKPAPSVDGRDRVNECNTHGNNTPDLNYRAEVVDGEEVAINKEIAGLVMPDIVPPENHNEGGGFFGNPSEIYDEDTYADFNERGEAWPQAKGRIHEYIIDVMSSMPTSDPRVSYAGPDEEIGLDIQSGIIIVDGGVLNLKGNECFSGLIINRGGEINSSGTASILGAVIGEDFIFSGNGNPNIYYSSQALDEVEGLAGIINPNGGFDIGSWSEAR